MAEKRNFKKDLSHQMNDFRLDQSKSSKSKIHNSETLTFVKIEVANILLLDRLTKSWDLDQLIIV